MNLLELAEKAGETALSIAFPGVAGPIIAGVNALLPDDKKLPDNATGTHVKSAITSLSPEQQVVLMSKRYDVEIAEINSFANIQKALAEADATGNSTRPEVAVMMAEIICFSVISLISVLCVAMLKHDTDTLKALPGVTTWVVGILATPTALLYTYFGKRTKEKLGRYAIAGGQQKPTGIISTVAGLIRR